MKLLAGMLLALTTGAYGASVEHDFGQASDTSPNSEIWSTDSEPDWSALWWTNRADLTNSTMALYENEDDIYWILKPLNTAGMIDGRAIKFRRDAKFRFDDDSSFKYLTVRFKDSVWRPAKIYNGDGSLLGTVGGEDDKRWKTQQIQAGRITSPVRIGTSYTDDLSGQIVIDRMKISSDDSYDFPADESGFWPVPAENRHADLGRTNDFGDGPTFLWGIYSRQFFTDGGAPETCGSGLHDSFGTWAHVKMNTIVHHGWEQNWDSRWQEYPNEATYARPGVLVEMGLEEMLFQAKCHGLKVIPNYLTDTRAYWMRKDGGNSRVVSNFAGWAEKYAGDPTLLAHNPVDEWDHEGVDYSKPQAVSQQYYQVFKDGDPDTPVYMSLMGFGENTAWETAKVSADILANDKYCHEYKNSLGFVDLVKGCERAYDYMRDMYQEVGDNKLRVYIPNFGENDLPLMPGSLTPRMLNQQEQVFQSYTGIVAGAQGIILFADVNPHKNVRGVESAWEGLAQMGDELMGERGIAHLLVAPSTTIEMGSACNKGAKSLLRQDPEGNRMLIVVNFSHDEETISCMVDGLEDGTHEVRFENATIESENGGLVDTIEPMGRRVFMLSGDFEPIPPPIDPPADICDLFPTLPQCEELPPVDPCEEDPSLDECQPERPPIDWCDLLPGLPGCEVDPPPVPECGEGELVGILASKAVHVLEYSDCVTIRTNMPVTVEEKR